jgi:class 3 adenylate cyclase/predicted ATPase
MRCAKCGNDNPADSSFCEGCGTKLELVCPTCKTPASPGARFCKKCGIAFAAIGADSSQTSPSESLVKVTADASSAPEVIDGERKTVTALFADLKGSTELMEDLDPEEARAIIDPAVRIMVEAVHRYEGYVVQSRGDGIFALFGAPAAYEDHPQRALYAALQMQRELREHGQRRAATGAHAPVARVGVNTGEVVVRSVEIGGKVEYTPIGHTLNLGSRLEMLAPAGSIAVSEYTRNLCEGYFELRSLGPMAVKGISEPINVYEVTGLGALRTHFELAARRGLTKFVGRERELEQIRHALDTAIAGHGQIVAVMAEAGTGKSRLFHEFKTIIPMTCKVLEAYSVSHGKASAWLPVLELLRDYFGLADADDAAARREKVGSVLGALDPALEDTLPYLFGLLGIVEGSDPIAQMDPQIKRQRTLDAIRRIMLRESLNQPVVIIFEDLHWIDAHTQALLDLLTDSVANSRVLLLVNYRPEYRHEWTSKSCYAQLRLSPLGGAHGSAMIATLLGNSVELEPLRRLVAERTGGNPFFIEEIVQALFDEGALARNGEVKVTRSLSQLRLPPTVQGILAARIDRQPSEHKQLLQTLAVIGRESSLALLRQVASHPDDQLERMLGELRASEFIYEQPAAAGVEYVFKHALTQEVAYNSLLIERRKQLHERAGQALESIFADQLDDHLTELAHHYSHSDNLEKAVEYLGRAGQQAMQRSAHADAIGNLNLATDLLQKLPESPERIRRELFLQLTLGPALIAIEGYAAQAVERVYARACSLCEGLGEPAQLFPALFGLWAVYYLRGELSKAYALAEQLMLRAESAKDPVLQIWGHMAVGDTLSSRGNAVLAADHFEKALALYDPQHSRPFGTFLSDVRLNPLSYLGLNLWALGYPDRALRRSNEALEIAQAQSSPHDLAFAEFFASRLHQLMRDGRATQEVSERLITLSTEHGFSFWLAQARIELGGAIAEQGRNEEGLAQMQDGLAALRANGPRRQYLCLLAKACTETGRFDRGLSALTEALAMAYDYDAHEYEAEMHRLKGELLLRRDDSNAAEAEDCFLRAIEIARNWSAKSWELRATTSLARLLNRPDRRDEACRKLAVIYDWFTEGFDTADLKDAKALLHELST